jgi:acyl-CoA thioester hydrolase
VRIKENGILAAEIEVHGAWMDLIKRKLTKQPPEKVRTAFDSLEKSEDFEIILLSKN